MNRAVALLAEAKGAGRGRAAVKPLRVVGNHPADEAPIELYDGRYGHYVKHGGINATVPQRPQAGRADGRPGRLAAGRTRRQGRRQEAGAARRPPQGESQAKANGAPRSTRRPTTRKRNQELPRRRRRPSARPRPTLRPAPGPMAKGRVPTRDELLAFIKESATPVGKREIARAFGLKGDQRIELKELLRDLRDDGDIAADRAKTFKRPRGTDRHHRTRDRAGRRRRPPARRAAPARRGKGRPAAAHRDRPARPRAAAAAPAVGDRVLASLKRRGKDTYEARIIRRLGSGPQEDPRPLRGAAGSATGSACVTPTDRKLRREIRRPAGRQERRASRATSSGSRRPAARCRAAPG